MYTAFYLLVIGQGILLSKWFIEFAGLLTVSILSLVRIKAEEQKMREAFGDEYKAYMQRAGRLIPKILK